ncbi:MAG: DUF3473 domain-containing protein, partial [Proteobacteria bacterium]|nr:DUF3473 domain-containing protein [Pseudomonadota bacterium]
MSVIFYLQLCCQFFLGRSKKLFKISLIELPISVTRLLGKRLCFFGGGYLRLFPISIIKRAARKILAES